jgi:hypothetical protein
MKKQGGRLLGDDEGVEERWPSATLLVAMFSG